MSEAQAANLDDKQRGLEVKVGAFVVGALLLAAVVVFLLGSRQHLFQHRAVLRATFSDVQGLRVGAPVWLGGVSVGDVASIELGARGDPSIHVTLEVSWDALNRLGRDSVARIGTQGLLGDKIIELSATTGGPPLANGDRVATVAPADVNKMLEQASAVLGAARHVADNAADLVGRLADPRVMRLIHGALSSVRALLREAESGHGLVHALFYDQREARRFDQLLATVDELMTHVDRGVARVDTLLGSVDDDGAHVINNISRAAKNVGDAAADLHHSHVVAHLDRAAGDLADMTSYAKSGRGTLGALLMDPTVYEQLVTILGGIGRSRILRWLVRYAIQKDDRDLGPSRIVDEPEGKATPRR